MAERTCELCGAPLLKKPGRAGTPTRWCSTPCRRVADAARSRAYYANQPRKPQATLPDIECAGCGVMFPPTGHQGGGPPQKWCTGACRARWKRANDPTILERQRARRRVKPQPSQAKYTEHQRAARRRIRSAARGTSSKGSTWAMGWCHRCGTPFTALANGSLPRWCSEQCSVRESARRQRESGKAQEHSQRRRARKRNAFVAPVHRLAIFERDRWTCQLCGQRLERNAVVPSPLAPTIDHVIPLANGGTHEPANVQAAHFLCNVRKGDRPANDQLRLVG